MNLQFTIKYDGQLWGLRFTYEFQSLPLLMCKNVNLRSNKNVSKRIAEGPIQRALKLAKRNYAGKKMFVAGKHLPCVRQAK